MVIAESGKISDFLIADTTTYLKTTDRFETLEVLVDQLDLGVDSDPFLKALHERESIVSTAIGMGVAIPHAKLPTFDRFFIALGIHQGEGIEWDSIDHLPANLVFLIGGPEAEQKLYLTILSRITAAMRSESLRSNLLHSHCKAEVHNLLMI